MLDCRVCGAGLAGCVGLEAILGEIDEAASWGGVTCEKVARAETAETVVTICGACERGEEGQWGE